MSIVATKFAGSIEGEYVPLTGARLDAETGVALDDGAALDGDVPGPLDELQAVLSRASRPKATVETAADEIRLDRVTITSSDPLDVAIVAAGG
ncbi:MAG: hypothetical protein E6G52_03400 [Actinobacteria bacterium]|nr:MAG: hypothetical protein E6G52_03400 [Actinomycetota bacterium]